MAMQSISQATPRSGAEEGDFARPPGIESEVDGMPRISESNLWTLSLGQASISFPPIRPSLFAILILPLGRYAQFSKWTRISGPACRSPRMAAGSSIHKLPM